MMSIHVIILETTAKLKLVFLPWRMSLCRDKNWREEVLSVLHILPEVMEEARNGV